MSELDFILRKYRELTFRDGLDQACRAVETHGGKVIREQGETVLILGNEEATVFQPYADIDRFYYEI